jgi:hypothetical protein
VSLCALIRTTVGMVTRSMPAPELLRAVVPSAAVPRIGMTFRGQARHQMCPALLQDPVTRLRRHLSPTLLYEHLDPVILFARH